MNAFSWYNFMKLCYDNGITPILGVEMYVCNDVNIKQAIDGVREKYKHVTLLASNQVGYQNLISLITDAELQYKYFHPRVDMGILKQYSEGVICLSGCCNGVVPRSIDRRETILNLKEIYQDRFFIEVMRVQSEGEDELNRNLIALAEELKVHVVATTDVHYYKKEEGPYHEKLLGININSEDLKFPSYEFYYKSQEEMYETWIDYPYAVDNIDRVIQMIEPIPIPKSIPIPRYSILNDPLGVEFNAANIPDERREIEFLSYVCYKTLDTITLHGTREEYVVRLQQELDVIDLMDQAGYILTTRRVTNHVQSLRGLQNYGRGSCGGSLVCYLTGITLDDPIQIRNQEGVELLFSRFLNKGRCIQYDFDVKQDGYSYEEFKRYRSVA